MNNKQNEFRRVVFKNLIPPLIPPLIPLALGTVILELLLQKDLISSLVIPRPTEVLQTLFIDHVEYFEATTQTLMASVLGLFLSSVAGVATALLLLRFVWLEKAFSPYAILFQTVPVISIAPLLVIWFGFGLPTVVASAFIVSIFPMIANTLHGLRSVSKPLLDLFKIYQQSPNSILWKLQLPSAVPHIYVGLRIACGLAFIGSIVGEFIAGGGLGGLIDMARTQQRLDKMFAAIFITSASGILILTLISWIFRLCFRRWPDFRNNEERL